MRLDLEAPVTAPGRCSTEKSRPRLRLDRRWTVRPTMAPRDGVAAHRALDAAIVDAGPSLVEAILPGTS